MKLVSRRGRLGRGGRGIGAAPHHQVQLQQNAVTGVRRRAAAAALDPALHGQPGHRLHRIADRSQWWAGHLALRQVIKSDNRHFLGNGNPLLLAPGTTKSPFDADLQQTLVGPFPTLEVVLAAGHQYLIAAGRGRPVYVAGTKVVQSRNSLFVLTAPPLSIVSRQESRKFSRWPGACR